MTDDRFAHGSHASIPFQAIGTRLAATAAGEMISISIGIRQLRLI
jgi:hypothetical protein